MKKIMAHVLLGLLLLEPAYSWRIGGGTPPATHATIVLQWEASALAAPPEFRTNCQAAATMIQNVITDNITVNILVGYGDYFNGQQSGLTTGASGSDVYGSVVTYTNLRNALPRNSTDQINFYNALPATATLQGVTNFYVPAAAAKALGFIAANAAPLDGAVGIGTAVPTANLIGVCLHEIGHAMGRVPGDEPFEFGRFTAVGTRLFSSSSTAPAAYFSVDGGTTKIADYGQASDPSDFLDSGVQGSTDPYNEHYDGSTQQSLTVIDKRQIDVSGFNAH